MKLKLDVVCQAKCLVHVCSHICVSALLLFFECWHDNNDKKMKQEKGSRVMKGASKERNQMVKGVDF